MRVDLTVMVSFACKVAWCWMSCSIINFIIFRWLQPRLGHTHLINIFEEKNLIDHHRELLYPVTSRGMNEFNGLWITILLLKGYFNIVLFYILYNLLGVVFVGRKLKKSIKKIWNNVKSIKPKERKLSKPNHSLKQPLNPLKMSPAGSNSMMRSKVCKILEFTTKKLHSIGESWILRWFITAFSNNQLLGSFNYFWISTIFE